MPKVEQPYIPPPAATPPPPEQVAEAPELSEGRRDREDRQRKRRGSSALRIDLIGGTSALKAGGLGIPT